MELEEGKSGGLYHIRAERCSYPVEGINQIPVPIMKLEPKLGFDRADSAEGRTPVLFCFPFFFSFQDLDKIYSPLEDTDKDN